MQLGRRVVEAGLLPKGTLILAETVLFLHVVLSAAAVQERQQQNGR
jgi:hypothetical protein